MTVPAKHTFDMLDMAGTSAMGDSICTYENLNINAYSSFKSAEIEQLLKSLYQKDFQTLHRLMTELCQIRQEILLMPGEVALYGILMGYRTIFV